MTTHSLPRNASQFNRWLEGKISQRGEFSATALFNQLDWEAADAAENLRRLVDRIYGDQAETVKAEIRDQYDAIIPDNESGELAEEIKNLKAIIQFYRKVAGKIKAGTFELPKAEQTSIYDLAHQTIEGKRQWSSGETVAIWTGKAHRAYIAESGRDGGGLLTLVFANGKPGETAAITAGILSPVKGWIFTLTQASYQEWAAKARKLATK